MNLANWSYPSVLKQKINNCNCLHFNFLLAWISMWHAYVKSLLHYKISPGNHMLMYFLLLASSCTCSVVCQKKFNIIVAVTLFFSLLHLERSNRKIYILLLMPFVELTMPQIWPSFEVHKGNWWMYFFEIEKWFYSERVNWMILINQIHFDWLHIWWSLISQSHK